MRKNVHLQNKYYFSERLKKQLSKMSHHSLTFVEAPSGFGKTTAVREYLNKNLPHGAREYWYTCLGESSSMAWLGICELFSNINAKVADDLKNLKMPTMNTLFYLTSYLRDVHCQTETYFVVDNYQLIHCDIPRELLSVFSMHGNTKLHMIFITQPLETKHQIILNNNIHTINASSFFFDKDDTACLLRLEGIHLTDEELEKLFISTEGWVSAIHLQINNFLKTGLFDSTVNIEKLVEKTIWNRLAPEEKDFLLLVSVLDSFTIRQAAIMLNQEVLSEKVKDLLKNNDFIKYLPDKSMYGIHSILRDYLRKRFYNQMPEDYQNQIFRKAGVSYVAMSLYYPASEFFYKVGDFDAILALPFSRENLDKYKGKKLTGLINAIVNECPDEILCKYPFSMIVFGYYLITNGQIETYQKLCSLLHLAVQNEEYFGQKELRRIKGEFSLLRMLGEFNNIPQMMKCLKTASELLDKPSIMIKSETPWLFATTSVLNIFWKESGKLEDDLQQADISANLFFRIGQGHGIGYNSVMRAEALLMRGEDHEAKLLCYKALYEARSYLQFEICICAELVLARIAILRGAEEDYFTAIRNMQNYTKENSNLYVLHMVEHCMSVLGLILDIKFYMAPWIYDMENIKNVLYSPLIPLAQILYLNHLLTENRYNELYGITQHILDNSEDRNGNIKYLMVRVYCFKFLAIAKYNNGDRLAAQEYLEQALSIALPDRIYLPFAQDTGRLKSLLESLKNSVSDKEGINALIELGRRQERGMKIIKKAIISDKSPLTPREREIAQLARERLSAREIADRLYITETTVRTILRNVYSKLDIHSKAELVTKKF